MLVNLPEIAICQASDTEDDTEVSLPTQSLPVCHIFKELLILGCVVLKMGWSWEGGQQCAKENFTSSSLEGPWPNT